MESTLSLTYADLVGEVGLFLGYGRGANFADQAFTSQQAAAIESCVRSGLRQFYFPPPQEGTSSSYDWSFLKPMATLAIAVGGSVVPLPDDFGGVEGKITLTASTSTMPYPVSFVGPGEVEARFAASPRQSGRPQIACVQPIKGTGPTQGQRFQMSIFPLADLAYTMQFQYYILPDALTGANPFIYGGMMHSETVLESCLAIAEQRIDDASAVHTNKFQERLVTSISMDRRLKPQLMGYNGDRSDSQRSGDRRDGYWNNSITYKGVQY